MDENERKEALENIELIKELVTQTKREMRFAGGGWISIIWGIFCLVGLGGQRLLNPTHAMRGLWWTVLVVIGILASILVARSQVKTETQSLWRDYLRWFLLFWIPFLILAYVLTFFCVFLPGLSREYIPTFILLVISTGYLIIGLLIFRGILIMGILGMTGTIITAIFFLEYQDIILGLLFGLGLIITGLVINRKWKNSKSK